jgi:hypothetical protein
MMKIKMKTLLKFFQILFCVLLVVGTIACSAGPKLKCESAASLRALLGKEAIAYPETSFIVFQ